MRDPCNVIEARASSCSGPHQGTQLPGSHICQGEGVVGAQRTEENRVIFKSQTCSIRPGTSLVVQWLRLCALKAGARVRSLVREIDPTFHH